MGPSYSPSRTHMGPTRAPQIVPIWVSNGIAQMGPSCVPDLPHMGPTWASHMGPSCLPMTFPSGPHVGSPDGPQMNNLGSPLGSHMAPLSKAGWEMSAKYAPLRPYPATPGTSPPMPSPFPQIISCRTISSMASSRLPLVAGGIGAALGRDARPTAYCGHLSDDGAQTPNTDMNKFMDNRTAWSKKCAKERMHLRKMAETKNAGMKNIRTKKGTDEKIYERKNAQTKECTDEK